MYVLLYPVGVVVDVDHGGSVLVLHLDVDLPDGKAPDRMFLGEAGLCLDEPLDVTEGAGKLQVVVTWRKVMLR